MSDQLFNPNYVYTLPDDVVINTNDNFKTIWTILIETDVIIGHKQINRILALSNLLLSIALMFFIYNYCC